MTLDIGMYMAHLGQVAYPKSEVERIQSMSTFKNGVDQTVLTNIMFTKNGDVDLNSRDETKIRGLLQYYVTGAANTEERVTIQGSKGRIMIDSPSHVPERIRVIRDAGRGKIIEKIHDFPLPDDSFTTWNYPGSIGFTHEIKGVCDALREGRKECTQFSWDDSVQLATILDEIIAQTKGKLNENVDGNVDVC